MGMLDLLRGKKAEAPARARTPRPEANSTQFAANYDGGLGSTNTAVNAASGLRPGMGASGNTFGTLALTSTGSVFDPRQVVMNLRLRF